MTGRVPVQNLGDFMPTVADDCDVLLSDADVFDMSEALTAAFLNRGKHQETVAIR